MSFSLERLRIAILAHSTNPRGGVVHALALAEALTELGHEAVVHAPDAGGGFFRPTQCPTVCVPASPAGSDVAGMVEIRAADYVRWFADPRHRDFAVFHAQDGISANALATLKDKGLIGSFARTVHHVDSFADPRLQRLQERAIAAADRLMVVSRLWRDALMQSHGREAVLVGNGVDCRRFSPHADERDAVLRRRFGLGAGPVFLAVGGIEGRKNTHGILQAFARIHADLPTAQLIIAGGASLLDHGAYQQRFAEILAAGALPASAVLAIGPVADADMPSLYRIADALVFPSLKEGFGLVVLEAMASGLPVVVSRIAPFTEYLDADTVVWCDPNDSVSIASAMRHALDREGRGLRIVRGLDVARRHDWMSAAQRHLPVYAALADPAHD
jgi:glycosyltransferase-like protein